MSNLNLTFMKLTKTALTLLSILFLQTANTQNVGISDNGSTPFEGAILDLNSTTKGLLIPRLTTAQRLAMPNLRAGMMVFDTDDSHFWFYTKSWQQVSGTGWLLSGNAGTFSATDFIGTTDANALNFRTNNTNRLQLGTAGDLLFLSDQNSLQFANASATSNEPMMRMFRSGNLNRDRMVIGHSPDLPTLGLEYRDTTDAFYLREASGRKFAFELNTGHMGIGVEDPAFPLDAVGRLRLKSGSSLSNAPGIWFSNLNNTFDRALLGMSKADSGLGIFSQHLNRWAIEFELMREPRLGINTRNGGDGVVRAELHVMHTNFGGSNDGVRIQNEGPNTHFWNLYTSNSTGAFEFFKNGIKRATIDPISGAYTNVSDERLKKNIQKMPNGLLSKIMQLQPSTYQFKEMQTDEGGVISSNRYYYGFIAQEVEKLFPSLVFTGGDNPARPVYTMDYAGFGILAIKAIQEQQTIIDQQKAMIENLQMQMQMVMEKLKINKVE